MSDAALDLRPAELGIVVPLIACLLALSAWPAAISGHAFGGGGKANVSLTSQQYPSSLPMNCVVTKSGAQCQQVFKVAAK